MRLAAAILVPSLAVAACGSSSPSFPSKPPLAVTSESAHYVFHASTGTSIDTAWQEAYYQWATARLGVQAARKIGYYRYASRQDMGEHTGRFNTNGYADASAFEIHTLWPTDNHEVVHLFLSLVGDAPALFSEGTAVAFQVDPVKGDLASRFNEEEVHEAARRYLASGQLVLPLDGLLDSASFRGITDSTLAYREAGSFCRFLIDRYGIHALLAFFRGGSYSDTAAVAGSRFQAAFGVSVAQAEAAWLELLRSGAVSANAKM